MHIEGKIDTSRFSSSWPFLVPIYKTQIGQKIQISQVPDGIKIQFKS